MPPGLTENVGLGQMQLKAIKVCCGRGPKRRADQFGAVLPRGMRGRNQGLEGKGDIELRQVEIKAPAEAIRLHRERQLRRAVEGEAHIHQLIGKARILPRQQAIGVRR